MISRRLDPIEKFFANVFCYTQLLIELEDNKRVPEFVHKLNKYIVGFHLKINGDNITLHNNPQPVYDIPKDIRNYRDITNWLFYNHTPPLNQAFGSIAVRDNLICVNINHLCSDGVNLKNLAESLPLPEMDVKHVIPASTFTIFKDEIDHVIQSGIKSYYLSEDPLISRVIPKRKASCSLKNSGVNFKTAHVSELVCNHNGKIRGLTETLWSAIVLSGAVYNNNKLSPCGTATPVNIRPLLKGNIGKFESCNCAGSITTTAEIILDETVGDLGRRMRDDFTRKYNNGEVFGFQAAIKRAVVQGKPYPEPPGVGLELSNVGPVKISRPITNVFMSIYFPAGPSAESSFLTYSTVSDIPECNRITSSLSFSDYTLHLKDASLLNKSVMYAITHIRPETKIRDALDELRKFQSQY